jgi:predicted ABC-type ATPase
VKMREWKNLCFALILSLGAVGPVLGAPVYPTDAAVIDSVLAQAPKATHAPEIIFMAGGYGSGKSSIRSRLSELGVFPSSKYLVIDMDQIRERLPRYKKLEKEVGVEEAIGLTRHEVADIADGLRIRALQKGINLVIDQSLRGEEASDWVRAILKTAPKYKSTLIYVDTDPVIAIRRAQAREHESGRGAPESKVKSSREGAAETFRRLKNTVDTAIEIDNDREPRVVSLTRNGNTSSVEQPLSKLVPILRGEGSVASVGAPAGFDRADCIVKRVEQVRGD